MSDHMQALGLGNEIARALDVRDLGENPWNPGKPKQQPKPKAEEAKEAAIDDSLVAPKKRLRHWPPHSHDLGRPPPAQITRLRCS